ncbi:MAG: hypothetical protein IKT35_03010 [Clostridia bacterium]|nr:hypothetical protein [Clostridia bacterium]
MKTYLCENKNASGMKIALEDMILTKEYPTTAGSKMLEGFVSLFDAEVVEKLTSAGYEIGGKVNVGEFAIDLLGETSYFDGLDDDFVSATSKVIADGDAYAVVGLDVNGAQRRAAAISGQVNVKPTYGTVSRFGTIPVACSGECVSITADSVNKCRLVLSAVAGHDDKDGTSLSDENIGLIKADADFTPAKKVAVIKGVNTENVCDILKNSGVEVEEIDADTFIAAKTAWNILMSAELCNNVSRYDGVKFGYRSENYKTIGELYTNSRSEAFGEVLKTAILYGSDALSTENYFKVYDKALRIRRVMCEKFAEIFKNFDAIIMPAVSKEKYEKADVESNKLFCFDENVYTAPASISGLPVVTAGGVQIVGKAFSENVLFALAEVLEKEGK